MNLTHFESHPLMRECRSETAGEPKAREGRLLPENNIRTVRDVCTSCATIEDGFAISRSACMLLVPLETISCTRNFPPLVVLALRVFISPAPVVQPLNEWQTYARRS